MATAISIADKVVRPTSDTAGVEDGDVYGCSSLDRRNADKSGAEMKGGMCRVVCMRLNPAI